MAHENVLRVRAWKGKEQNTNREVWEECIHLCNKRQLSENKIKYE